MANHESQFLLPAMNVRIVLFLSGLGDKQTNMNVEFKKKGAAKAAPSTRKTRLGVS